MAASKRRQRRRERMRRKEERDWLRNLRFLKKLRAEVIAMARVQGYPDFVSRRASWRK